MLDAELVAVDRADGNRLKAFQELSTRARGEITAHQVSACMPLVTTLRTVNPHMQLIQTPVTCFAHPFIMYRLGSCVGASGSLCVLDPHSAPCTGISCRQA